MIAFARTDSMRCTRANLNALMADQPNTEIHDMWRVTCTEHCSPCCVAHYQGSSLLVTSSDSLTLSQQVPTPADRQHSVRGVFGLSFALSPHCETRPYAWLGHLSMLHLHLLAMPTTPPAGVIHIASGPPLRGVPPPCGGRQGRPPAHYGRHSPTPPCSSAAYDTAQHFDVPAACDGACRHRLVGVQMAICPDHCRGGCEQTSTPYVEV
jgi:hypothetical protein